jgi:hypothetical protein
MNRLPLRTALRAGAAALALAALPVLAQMGYRVDAQGKDELWDVTSKMEMPGMPMAMPAQTSRVCVEKNNEAIPKQDNCTVLEAKTVGNKVTYRMACKDKNSDYIATGESMTSGGAYEGKMRMAGKMEGQQMDMSMSYSGKRAGNCVSTIKQDVAAMQAQGAKAQADACRDGIERLQWMLFFEGAKPACAAQQKDFCAAVGRVAQSMQDPGQYASATGKYYDLKTSFGKCGQDFEAPRKQACGRALSARSWQFVGSGNCDDEVRLAAPANCAGRGGSPDPQYYPLCARYATISRGTAATGTAGSPAPGQSAQPAKAPQQPDAVQQGLDAVKKLLPF